MDDEGQLRRRYPQSVGSRLPKVHLGFVPSNQMQAYSLEEHARHRVVRLQPAAGVMVRGSDERELRRSFFGSLLRRRHPSQLISPFSCADLGSSSLRFELLLAVDAGMVLGEEGAAVNASFTTSDDEQEGKRESFFRLPCTSHCAAEEMSQPTRNSALVGERRDGW